MRSIPEQRASTDCDPPSVVRMFGWLAVVGGLLFLSGAPGSVRAETQVNETPGTSAGFTRTSLNVSLGPDRELGRVLYNPSLTKTYPDSIYDAYRVEFSSDTVIPSSRFIVDIPFERQPADRTTQIRMRLDGRFVVGQLEAAFFNPRSSTPIGRYPPGVSGDATARKLVRETFHSLIVRVPDRALTVSEKDRSDPLDQKLYFQLPESLSNELHRILDSGHVTLKYYEYLAGPNVWKQHPDVDVSIDSKRGGRIVLEASDFPRIGKAPWTGTIVPVSENDLMYGASKAIRTNNFARFRRTHFRLLNDDPALKELMLDASSHGRYRYVSALLKRDIHPSVVDYIGRSGLMLASTVSGTQGLRTARRLYQQGADPSQTDNWNNTPLHTAVRHNNKQFVEWFPAVKKQVNQSNVDGFTPLYLAYVWNKDPSDTTVIRNLIEAGARIDVNPDNAPSLPLYVFNEKLPVQALNQYNPLVQLLLEGHRQTPAPTELGKVLPRVISLRRFDFARKLVEKWKVHPDVLTKTGLTPVMMLAKMHEPSRNLLKSLLEAGVELNTYGEDGETALTLALRKQKPWFVKQLLDFGAHPDQKLPSKSTPLHRAVKSNRAALNKVKLLHRAGADLNSVDADGRTPLALAIERGKSTVVNYLKEQGAEVPEG